MDVIGTSKGKGFQGVVKRHHFGGGSRTHGQSDRLRARALWAVHRFLLAPSKGCEWLEEWAERQ